MLEVRGLDKAFPGNRVLSQVSLSVLAGEFFSLLGPSGCGKTTLLRILAGLDQASAGEVWQEGRRVDILPPHERQFNLVFQRYALFPHLNVWGNVAFGLQVKKVSPAEVKQRVEDALGLVQMSSFGSRLISTLSGGQQQRVALARALVNRPKVLLLDEPLSALDLKLRRQMQVELLALQRRLKHTFIFVTHDQEEALTLSDRIAVMNAGVIEQVGTPQEIYEFPKNLFVAQFIGSINAFEGHIQEVRPELVSVVSAAKRPFRVSPARDGSRPLPQVSIADGVRVLVRPEKLKLLRSAPGQDQNSVEGVLKEVLYQGAVTRFHVTSKEGSQAWVIEQPNTALTARKSFHLGDKIFVAWFPEDCTLMKVEPLP